jgi:hypothetical protein
VNRQDGVRAGPPGHHREEADADDPLKTACRVLDPRAGIDHWSRALLSGPRPGEF